MASAIKPARVQVVVTVMLAAAAAVAVAAVVAAAAMAAAAMAAAAMAAAVAAAAHVLTRRVRIARDGSSLRIGGMDGSRMAAIAGWWIRGICGLCAHNQPTRALRAFSAGLRDGRRSRIRRH